MQPTIATLFKDKTYNWGLRGDKVLWAAMQQHFATTPLPATSMELEEKIAAAFKNLTGEEITKEKKFFIEKYSIGHGMSDGMVSPAWWQKDGIPFLLNRYEKEKATGNLFL